MLKYNFAYRNYIFVVVPKNGQYRISGVVKDMEMEVLCRYEFKETSDPIQSRTILIGERPIVVYKIDYADNFVFKNRDDGKNYECWEDGTIVETNKSESNTYRLIYNVIGVKRYVVTSTLNCTNQNIMLLDVNNKIVVPNPFDTKLYIRTDTFTFVQNVEQSRSKRFVHARNNKIYVTYDVKYKDACTTAVSVYDMPQDYCYKFTDPHGINCDIDVEYYFEGYNLKVRTVNQVDFIDVYTAIVNGKLRVGNAINIPYDYTELKQIINDVEFDTPVLKFSVVRKYFSTNLAFIVNPYVGNIEITYLYNGLAEPVKKTIKNNTIVNTIVPYNAKLFVVMYNDKSDVVYFDSLPDDLISLKFKDDVMYIETDHKLVGNYSFCNSDGIAIHDGQFTFRAYRNKFLGRVTLSRKCDKYIYLVLNGIKVFEIQPDFAIQFTDNIIY